MFLLRSFYRLSFLLGLLILGAGCNPDTLPPPSNATPGDSAAEWTLDSKYLEEFTALEQVVPVKDALDHIVALEPQTLEEHIWLNEIPAPPFKEEERAMAFAGMLQEAGADSVWTDEEGNVIALRNGVAAERTVALAAHLDTVFPEGTDVTVEIRGDTLFAPGIGDDTRGLMVVLTVLRALHKAGIRTESDLLFIGTVGEEGQGDLRGVRHLFSEEGIAIDSWIAVDGGGIGKIVNQALGSHRYRVTFKGPGGHSWGAFGLANPEHALGTAIHKFVEKGDHYTKTGPKTSYNVGVMSGGTSVNSIPFMAWMEVDMRSVSPERLLGIDSLFQEAVQEALLDQNKRRRDGPPLVVDVQSIGKRPSGMIAPDVPLVQRSLAMAQHLGEYPLLAVASTDSNIPIAAGIPAVTIGRGGQGDGAHSLNEWWANIDGHRSIQGALLLILAEAGLVY